ncbi:MAG: sialate O-acetylesterase [Verrucomicrobiota bacterium]
MRRLLAPLIYLSAVSALSALDLASPFSSHMVLQRDREIPVWGTSDPNISVTVRFADQETITTTDSKGKWSVSFSPLGAGGNYTLSASSGSENIALVNITMGDVWICSGQSNMQWSIKQSKNPVEETAAADYPDIRILTVPRITHTEPQSTFKASWAPCSPDSISNFSAVGYFFGRKVHQTTGVPIGLISTNWGGTPAEAWTPLDTLNSHPEYLPILERRTQFLKEQAERDADPDYQLPEDWKKRPRPQKQAAMLYNQMIHPLIRVPIRGVIWYQGEGNANRAEQYRTLFPAMIHSWREAWGQGDFPFYFVQLANYLDRNAEPVEHPWAELRDAQFETLAIPNTGMAVAIDIGEAKDIHPKNKQDVGKRLALWALAHDYGITEPKGSLGSWPLIGRFFQQPIVYSGPLYSGSEVNDKQIRIRFDHIADGLASSDGQPLVGFSIAGADRKFVWANAVIEGETVVVSHPDITEPAAVRYGWSANPAVNLVNTAGLPASPFRTDDWPGVTVGKQ